VPPPFAKQRQQHKKKDIDKISKNGHNGEKRGKTPK